MLHSFLELRWKPFNYTALLRPLSEKDSLYKGYAKYNCKLRNVG